MYLYDVHLKTKISNKKFANEKINAYYGNHSHDDMAVS